MTGRASSILRAALAIALLGVLLPLPTRPEAYIPQHFLPPPVDLAVIVLVLCLLPRASRPVCAAFVLALAGLTLWRLADIGMVLAFRRSFNPILDLHLVASGWELGSATIGTAPAALALCAAGLLLVGLFLLLAWALGGIARMQTGPRGWLVAAALALSAIGADAVLPRELVSRADRLVTAVAGERRFAERLGQDDLPPADFAALAGRDVIFLFVESYGRAWLEAAPYRSAGRARLAAAESRLREAGFSVRSGWARAPTRGGQSWLAHGAVMSGLWTASQARYDALIASDRVSLNRLFTRAGWRTAAVMPAITRDWPEAAWFGYDTVLDRDGLGYAGRPFDWVTMPDQYTLAAMDRLARRGKGPVMIEAALISSHAPWTPLPEILPWAALGDGAVFDGTRRSGAPPGEVWSDPATIRAAYSASLDYTLEVVAQWIARFAGNALVVVLGDHQPAPLIAGGGDSAAVPLHIVSRDADLLARLPGAWSDGMLPASNLAERSMTDIRQMFASCFSAGGCAYGGTD